MSPPEPRPRLPRSAIVADVLGGISLAIGLGISLFGATPRVFIHGVPFSIRTPGRAVIIGLIILAFRHRRDRRHPVIKAIVKRFNGWHDSGERRLFAPPGSHSVREWLLVTAGFIALVALMTWPQIANLHSVPDPGDPLFSMWRLAWVAHQLATDPWHLFEGNIFFPEHLTLTYSDPILIPALVAAPFFWMGGHPTVIYNLLLLSGMALSGATMYMLTRALTGRRDAAAVAGVLFALYPMRFEHYSHLELQMTTTMPLAVWSLHRTIVSGRVRDGLLTGLAFTIQMLSSLYYGLFLAVYMLPLGLVLWLGHGRPRRAVMALAAGGLLAGLLVAPVAVPYVQNKPMLGERDVASIIFYSATPADYLRPHVRSALYGRWSPGLHPERLLFPGLVAIGLAVVALWPPWSLARAAYALAFFVAFDCSLGLRGFLYPWLHAYLGPFRGLRVPARFSILVGFSLSMFAGFAITRILERWPRRAALVTAVALGALLVELRPRLLLAPVWPEPPAIYTAIPRAQKAILAEFPTDDDGWLDFRYIYFSTFHWHQLINGSSGFFPPSFHLFQNHTWDFPGDEAIDYLKTRNVNYIAVHGAFYGRTEDYRRIDEALHARRDLQEVASAPFAGSESTLYKLTR